MTNSYRTDLKMLLAVIAIWGVIHGALLVGSAYTPVNGSLNEPDSYMRLVRVSELVHGGGWYDSVIERSNAPYGDNLHWTRPFDILIIAGAAPLMPFLGIDSSLLWSAGLICPFLHLVTLLVLPWAARPLRVKGSLLLIAALAQPYLITQSMPGRADHHILQILLLVLSLGVAVRLTQPTAGRRLPWIGGAVVSIGIWVSVEMLLALIVTVAVLATMWIVRGTPSIPRALATYAAAATATLVVAIAVERPPAGWAVVEYDKISVVYMVATAMLAVTWVAISAISARPAVMGAGSVRLRVLIAAGALPLAVLVGAFPKVLGGPDVDVSPAIKSIWLNKVTELDPLFPSSANSLGALFLIAGQALIAVVAAPVLLLRAWRRGELFSWLAVAASLLVFFLLSLQHARSAGYLTIPASILVAAALGEARGVVRRIRWPSVRATAWSTASVASLGGFFVLGGAVSGESDIGNGYEGDLRCDLTGISEFLDVDQGLGDRQRLIAATIWYGPELLYRTRHAIIAGPYHRNAQGIVDLHELFVLPPDESRQIIDRRGVDLILLCPSKIEYQFAAEDAGPGSLDRLLRSNEPLPEWLSRVDVPAGVDADVLLFEVVR